jgi:hypothetical protein
MFGLLQLWRSHGASVFAKEKGRFTWGEAAFSILAVRPPAFLRD